jgi:hypothetical protein
VTVHADAYAGLPARRRAWRLAWMVRAVHTAYLFWVVFGAAIAAGHPAVLRLHLVCAAYAVFITAGHAFTRGRLMCPLTTLEHRLLARAGMPHAGEAFLLRWLPAGTRPPRQAQARLRWCVAAVAMAVAAIALDAVVGRAAGPIS